MKYALSESFTTKQQEGPSYWRKFDGRNQFRVISDKFLEVFAQWVVKPDGKGYTRYWPANDETPVLSEGERYEGNRPSRKVCFVVSPVEGHDAPAPVLMVVPLDIAQQMLAHANELQGLCVADFVILATGTGMQKQYAVRTMDPTPLNPELADYGFRFDILDNLL